MPRILFFAAFCIPQLAVKLLGLAHDGSIGPAAATLIAGLAVVASATMLAWASELAEVDIPQGLALAVVALVAVMPEYTVDIYFAWRAGADPAYASYAVANMTGANRLLIGVGWSAISILYWWRSGKKSFSVDRSEVPAIFALILATAISFIFPVRGSIGIGMGLVLFGVFALYVREASRHDSEDKLAEPFIERLIHALTPTRRRLLSIGLFLYCLIAILASAESFAEGLLELGREYGIEEFLLVQWLAPLASEAPELIVALLFAWRLHPKAGLSTLISSKVNQWTLLVGMLPMVYALSVYWHGGSGGWAMPLDERQTEEIFLTSAQSLWATILFCNFNFSLTEAALLFGLFAVQLAFPAAGARWGFGVMYLVLAVVWIIKDRQTRTNLMEMFLKKNNGEGKRRTEVAHSK